MELQKTKQQTSSNIILSKKTKKNQNLNKTNLVSNLDSIMKILDPCSYYVGI